MTKADGTCNDNDCRPSLAALAACCGGLKADTQVLVVVVVPAMSRSKATVTTWNAGLRVRLLLLLRLRLNMIMVVRIVILFDIFQYECLEDLLAMR